MPETTLTETSDPGFVIGIKRRTVLIVAATCFGGMFAVCAICGGFLYYFSGEYERQIEEAIERNAVVQKHIGSDVAITYDEMQSLMLSGLTEYCYEVRGPLGSGTVYADFVTVDADTEKIGYGMLKLSSGETYDLMSGERISGDDTDSIMSALRNKALSARRNEFDRHLRELLREAPDAPNNEERTRLDSRTNPFSNLQASLTRLGDLSMRRGETDEAIKHYRRALEMGPDYAPAHRGLGDAKIGEGKVSEALAEFRTAVKLDPDLADAHNSLAWALVTHPAEDGEYQDLDEAVASAKKACELDVDDVASLNTLGVAFYRNGDWDEAIAALEDSVDLGADIPHNWLFLAMAHWQQGNKEAARSLLAKSTAWRKQNKPDDELIRFFAEAEKLIGPVSRVEMRENSQSARIASPPAIQSQPVLLVHHDSAVYLSRSDGGRMRRVVHVEDYQWHSRPTISPNGKLLAWTAFRQRLTSPSVFIGDLNGVITYHVEGAAGPIWLSDQYLLLDRDGRVVRADLHAEFKETSFLEGNHVSLSANRRYLVFERDLRTVVREIESGEEKFVQLRPPARSFNGLAVSNDGQRIAYVGFEDRGQGVFVANVDDGKGELIANEPGREYFPSFSPDGTKMLYTAGHVRLIDDHVVSRIYVIDLASGQSRAITNAAFHCRDASWSADGRTVAMVAVERSVIDRVLKQGQSPSVGRPPVLPDLPDLAPIND